MSRPVAGVAQILWGVSLFQMVWAASVDTLKVLWPPTSVISGIHCLEVVVERVWVMETGMERPQGVVSKRWLTIHDTVLIFITTGLNDGNIALLVLSILSWIASAIQTVIGVILALLKKEVSLKHRNPFNFHILTLWRKITYIVLLIIEFLFLLIVLLLWITFGVVLSNPNSWVLIIALWESNNVLCLFYFLAESQQTSLLIAAFILALLALLCIIGALIFFYVARKCKSRSLFCSTHVLWHNY